MSYVVRGRLCGYICTECPEPLSNVTVRLYRLRKDQPVVALAVADPKDTFAVLDGKQVSAKASSLLAEGQTDEEGRFTIDLGEGKDYDGGPFEIDVYCGTVPHM